ncbi:hypothetical protein AD30_3395 [Escherichia coli 2-316-03_S4_C3]|nr:hep_Hag family protein [Escherichia coli]KDT41031.1 hypothetical protein AD15_5122 [Escherichia coli 3-105-05_S4_C2]KDY17148.1 hypothetical protein AD30_3395 [Escherichia coli 2-316-03_S4_C3]KEJ39635.1 hypothetical protein AB65_2701 [Escherichia coli 2-460-02_S1_C3]PVF81871.1 hep_Hag family protein [Escherichia coli]
MNACQTSSHRWELQHALSTKPETAWLSAVGRRQMQLVP